ncbi:hypothetical protein DFJ58DRAFT_916319 [Suillus subalutaceus]|uniref:uncharacterized protein n=1 Tax=Suillus subalutaceus TaxID=48586 RepID=UPI001B86EEFB|nr:uncharacterized protein DFJ58DRAFT_916319 [Suillus subalutaceus]KAG1842027.1 hypothetical protein DFJ58DRAFT_916319 [Suillus subalutaceus]
MAASKRHRHQNHKLYNVAEAESLVIKVLSASPAAQCRQSHLRKWSDRSSDGVSSACIAGVKTKASLFQIWCKHPLSTESCSSLLTEQYILTLTLTPLQTFALSRATTKSSMTTLLSPLADVTSRSATADAAQLRAEIDDDLAAITESMRILRFRRNGLAPISGLPNEILTVIFEYLEEEERLDGYDSRDIPACVAVTHVCRHWRNVAIECPTLWRFISSSSPFWLDVMLERSKEIPLIVKYSIPMPLEYCLEKVLPHLPRIEYLEFRPWSCDVGQVMDLLSSQPAPMLKTFKFWARDPVFLPTGPISGPIFRGQVPLLRDVEVDYCDLSWSLCTFGGLRTLRVQGAPLPDLLSALRCMPALEQLTLESIECNETMLFDEVPLARLEHIKLCATSFQTAILVFAHLALPVDVKVSLRLFSIQGPETFSDLFSAIYKHHGGSGPVLRSLRATNYNIRYMGVQFSTSREMKNPDDDDIRLSIQFFFDLPFVVQPDIVLDIWQTITHQTFFSGELEFIHFEEFTGFIWGLTAALRIEGSNVTYPSLRVLELRDMVLHNDELKDLRDILTMRTRHNLCIQDLRLTLCDNFTDDQARLFGEVVANIDCDRYTLTGGLKSRKRLPWLLHYVD